MRRAPQRVAVVQEDPWGPDNESEEGEQPCQKDPSRSRAQLGSRWACGDTAAAAAAAAAASLSCIPPVPAESSGSKQRSWAAPAKQTAPAGRAPAAAPARHPPSAAALRAAEAPAPPGPDSLRSICLGVLAEHLEDLLEDPYCCEHILPCLPAEAKACLLAVARLRRLLCDAALCLLADETHTVLDLHGCGEAVSEGAIAAALRRMPHLRQVGGVGWQGAGRRGHRASCGPPHFCSAVDPG